MVFDSGFLLFSLKEVTEISLADVKMTFTPVEWVAPYLANNSESLQLRPFQYWPESIARLSVYFKNDENIIFTYADMFKVIFNYDFRTMFLVPLHLPVPTIVALPAQTQFDLIVLDVSDCFKIVLRPTNGLVTAG